MQNCSVSVVEPEGSTYDQSNHKDPTCFSSLPYELRRKIWLLALEPRFLYLYVRQYVSPLIGDYFMKEVSRTVTIAFTCTVASTNPPTLSEDLVARTAEVQSNTSYYNLLPAEAAPRPNLCTSYNGGVPALLQVCYESRETALERYQLAFPAVEVDVSISHWRSRIWIPRDFARQAIRNNHHQRIVDQRKIWIDFEQDEVMVCAFPGREGLVESPLMMLKTFAQEEACKIKWAKAIQVPSSRDPAPGI